jgi:hypothetical protein
VGAGDVIIIIDIAGFVTQFRAKEELPVSLWQPANNISYATQWNI